MKPIRQLTSFFLLLLFLFSAVPKELIHEFFHEHESTDVICENGCGDHLSVQHQHCELLQLTHPPLYCSVETFSFAGQELLFVQQLSGICDYHYHSSPFLFFRGPPSLS